MLFFARAARSPLPKSQMSFKLMLLHGVQSIMWRANKNDSHDNQLRTDERKLDRRRTSERKKERKKKIDTACHYLICFQQTQSIDRHRHHLFTSSPSQRRPKNCLLSDEFNKAVLCFLSKHRKTEKTKRETTRNDVIH